MKKPLIAVTPLWSNETPWDDEKDMYWMRPGYLDIVQAAGGIPVMLPLGLAAETIEQVAQQFDGFLFCGGEDISPTLYNETILPTCGTVSEARDTLELALFRGALALNKPIFGICRGIQLINAAMGGSLHQDISTELTDYLEHTMPPPYNVRCHDIQMVSQSPLAQLLGEEMVAVNSYHHQCIKVLAQGLQVMATAPDGIIEAVYAPDQKFLWAVQWHPELWAEDEVTQKILTKFVESCRS